MHSGIFGTIKDLNGNLLAGALVNVTDGRKVVKSAAQGDYWRLLNPGTYTIEVSSPDTPGKVSKSVKVGPGTTRVDFVLEFESPIKYVSLKEKDESDETSKPGVIAIVLLAVAGVLLVVIVVMVLYYRQARKEYDYSKMEFT